MAPRAPDALGRVRRVAADARRRMWLARLARRLSWACSIAAIVFVILVALDRLAWIELRASMVGGLLAATALIVAWLLTLANRPTLRQAAHELDRVSGLRDRLRNGLELESVKGGFAALARRDAGDAAERSRASAISGPRAGAWTWLAVAIASVGVMMTLFVPRRAAPESPAVVSAPSPEVLERAAQAPDSLRGSEWESESAEQTAFDAAREIEEELRSGREPEEALAEASSRLEEQADAIERAQRASAEADRDLAERLRESTPPASEAVRDVWERLAEERPDEALEALERLRDELDGATQAERERIAQDLRELARAADDASADPEVGDESPAQPNDAWREALDAAADEADPTPPDDQTQARPDPLESDQSSEPDEPSSDPDRPSPRDRESSEDPSGGQDRLGDGQSSEQSDPDRPSDPTGDSGESERPRDDGSPQEPSQDGRSPADRPKDQPQRDPSGSESRDQPQQGEGSQAQDRQDPDAQDPASKRRDDPSQDTQGDLSPGEREQGDTESQPRSSDESQPSDAPTPADDQGADPNDEQDAPAEQTPEGAERGDEGAERQPQATGESDAEPDGTSEGAERRPANPDEAVDRVRRQLEERRSRGRDAERLREMARRLTDDTPDAGESERRGGSPADREPQDPTGGAPSGNDERQDTPPIQTDTPWDPNLESDVVDARAEDEASDLGDRPATVAEWLSPPEGDAAGSPTQAPGNEGSRRALERARRSLEAQPPPARYRDVVKQVFDRYGERLPPAEAAPSQAPSQDAVDAPRPAPSGG